jgi:acetate---CoA ligase (ADP-forming)
MKGEEIRSNEAGHALKKFLEPESVALIGVPRQSGPGSYNNAETMLRYGFQGRIYPINPNAAEICGLKAYPAIGDVPETVDLAVISVGRDRVLPMVEQCIRAGVKHLLIITQGFADADAAGRAMQARILATARENGVRILGPNTMGVVNNFRRFTSAFIDLAPPEVVPPVSLIAQTGVIQVAAQNMAYRNWGKAIDIGNGCDLDVVDALAYLADDPETKVIAVYAEGIIRGREFLEAAARATLSKPVLIFKSGSSQAGAKAALSHTGSLVGEDHVFDAVFRRAGVQRVKNGAELKDAIRALLLMGEMQGPRLGVLTITGAGGIMAADACEDFGLTLARLPEGLAEKLQKGIPDWIHIGNPIDIWPVGMIGGNYPGVFGLSLEELLKSPEVDGVVVILPVTSSPLHANLNMEDVVAQVRQRVGGNKPIALWPYIDTDAFVDRYEAIPGVACFETIEQAVQGLSFCHRRRLAKQRDIPVQKRFAYDRDAMKPLLDKGRQDKVLLGEDAMALLGIFGIPTVRGVLAGSRQDLPGAAAHLRYPLVLKLAGRAFLHKSEWGGVVTGIGNEEELLAAYDAMIKKVLQSNPDLTVEAVQLQEQVQGRELLMGLKRDPQFGPVVACGMGGVYTEIFRDVSRSLVPVDETEALRMLASLKMFPLLKGARGEASADLPALAACLERLSFLAMEIPDIAELDLNPVMAMAEGCVAVDARILWD